MIRAVYDAPGSEAGWVRFLELFAQLVGAQGAWLGHRTYDPSAVSIDTQVGFEEPWIRNYHDHYQHINPFFPGILRMRLGRCFHSREILSDREAMRSEFYSDFVAPQGFRIGSTGVRLLDDGQIISGLALQSHATSDEDGLTESLATQQLLVEPLTSALRVNQRFVELQALHADLMFAIEATRAILIVCDEQGSIRALSPAAEALLRSGDGLAAHQGRLTASSVRGRISLPHALYEAARVGEQGAFSGSHVLRVARPSGRTAYELTLLPVPERMGRVRARRGRVLVFIHDPESQPTPNSAVWSTFYGFTKRETQIAELLTTGTPLEDIAEHLKIRRETVKTHLKSLFQKTGTRRQSELVARLLGGPTVIGRSE